MSDPRVGVLFVCLGNICRSPLGEGVFQRRVEEAGLGASIRVDSCGTSGWHEGEAPHPGSVAVARRQGLDISGQRSRPVRPADPGAFRWWVCMDASNRERVAPLLGDWNRLVLMRDFDPESPGAGVPDPWGGDKARFQEVWQIVWRSSTLLLDRICEEEGLVKRL